MVIGSTYLNKGNEQSKVLNKFIFVGRLRSLVELMKIVGVWFELEGALYINEILLSVKYFRNVTVEANTSKPSPL